MSCSQVSWRVGHTTWICPTDVFHPPWPPGWAQDWGSDLSGLRAGTHAGIKGKRSSGPNCDILGKKSYIDHKQIMGWGIGSEKNSKRLTGQALDNCTLPIPETQKRPTDSARLVICNSKLYCPVLRTASLLSLLGIKTSKQTRPGLGGRVVKSLTRYGVC